MVRFALPTVIAVRHVRDHVLWLRFGDGAEGEVDLGAALRGPAFEALRDRAVFSRVRVDGATIAWPNEVDWSPEDLHDRVLATKGRSGLAAEVWPYFFEARSRSSTPRTAPATIRLNAAIDSPPESVGGIVAKPIADAFG